MNFLLPVLRPIGLMLWGWIVSTLTGPALKAMIISFLENVVEKFEAKAKETPDPKDDLDAKMYRTWLEQAKKSSEVKDVNNP